MDAPKVFISYSHDSDAHKQWVVKLAIDLRSAGIDAILDQWDLSPGQDTAAFMAAGISSAARVLMVCSELYVQKSEAGVGGVGYERLIVTAELVSTIDTKKFLPIVRGNASPRKTPTFLGPRLYVDFANDADYSKKLEEVVREIHGTPSLVKPPLGKNPFAGTAPRASAPLRVAGPSGITAGGRPILEDDWFETQYGKASAGLAKLNLRGSTELRFALHDPVNKSQIELLNAVQRSQIQTFGWPIGVVIDSSDDYRPKPVADGIVTEVAIADGMLSGRESYDFWAFRNSGDFYLLQSLFEDQRAPDKIFVDTRIVRVAESLMFCASIYENLGVAQNALLSVRVTHRGLAKRVLATASSRRHVFPAATSEDSSLAELQTSVSLLRQSLLDNVVQIVEPMFMLFDFKRFDRKVYQEIVENFVAGKVS